jgi:hypothetical protein
MTAPAPIQGVQLENVAIPIDVSAFVLSPSCAAEGATSRIAPITQPNYVGLRLDEALMRHDLTDPIDFHLTSPATLNPRLTDLGSNPPQYFKNRLGVYLHWSLPRCYRSGKASGANVPKTRPTVETDDSSSATFPVVPSRWLIVRRLTYQQTDGDNVTINKYQTWIVESNRVRKVQDIPDDVDLEVDVTPFIAEDPAFDQSKVLENQAEIFIGKRNPYSGWDNNPAAWSEQQKDSPTKDPNFINLTVLGSSNPLFPGMKTLICEFQESLLM